MRVLDVNDNLPIFYPQQYNISVADDVKPGAPLLLLSATDADTGVFGRVQYRMREGNVGVQVRIFRERTLNDTKTVSLSPRC